MSLGDEFQIMLASNVASNAHNKPNDFETTLAKPLDLPGEWEVALIDLQYPHNWTNLDKSIWAEILTDPTEDPDDREAGRVIVGRADQDLQKTISSEKGLPNMWVRRSIFIPAGN